VLVEFISHSMSKEDVKFIFNNLVPNLSGKMVVDVGSRLGPVLYGVSSAVLLYNGNSKF